MQMANIIDKILKFLTAIIISYQYFAIIKLHQSLMKFKFTHYTRSKLVGVETYVGLLRFLQCLSRGVHHSGLAEMYLKLRRTWYDDFINVFQTWISGRQH